MLTTVAAGRVFDWSQCIGMYSQSGQGFYAPCDFALTSDGTAYVTCRGGLALFARITKIHVDHKFIKEFGTSGYNDGQFIWPTCLALDQDENVYVSDDYLHRISIFDKEGTFQGHWGTQGDGDGQLNAPSGMKFDGNGALFVVDTKNNRVQKFDRDGKFLGKWGEGGSGPGELNMPWGLCFDGDGNVLVADWGNRRVQKFTPDGQFLASIGESGSGPGELNRPSGVAVDSEGDIYVTDWNAHKLNIYAPDGTFVTGLIGDAQEPSPWAKTLIAANPDMLKARRRANMEVEWRFRRPVAVNVDTNDRVYVLEQYRHRFQVYDKLKDFQEHALNA